MPLVIKIAVVEHVQMRSNSRPEELSTRREDLLYIPRHTASAACCLPASGHPLVVVAVLPLHARRRRHIFLIFPICCDSLFTKRANSFEQSRAPNMTDSNGHICSMVKGIAGEVLLQCCRKIARFSNTPVQKDTPCLSSSSLRFTFHG